MDLKDKGKVDFHTFKKNEEKNSSNNYNKNNSFKTKNFNKSRIERNTEVDDILKKLEDGYRDKNKEILKKEVVSDYAKKIAENLEISSSQLRSFFNELKKLKLKYNKKEDFDKLQIALYILKSKLEYRKGTRSNKNEKEEFKKFSYFIQKNIDIIIKENENSVESFKDFMIFFETIIGYMYGSEKVKK
jgi:CRISPR type III-A/MTUBE-associated protein Csm2